VPDESLSLFPFGTGVLAAAPAGIQKTLRDFGVSGGLRHALGFGALLVSCTIARPLMAQVP
jgi:hypothetical protein